MSELKSMLETDVVPQNPIPGLCAHASFLGLQFPFFATISPGRVRDAQWALLTSVAHAAQLYVIPHLSPWKKHWHCHRNTPKGSLSYIYIYIYIRYIPPFWDITFSKHFLFIQSLFIVKALVFWPRITSVIFTI